jgi:hypothetical protein
VFPGRIEGDKIELAEDRRDLDRDVLHIIAGEEIEVGLYAAAGFALTQDRLAQLIEVEAHAVLAPLPQIAA